MSYYDNDQNRSYGGQFYNHTNANIGEQWVAGVNPNDSYMSAHIKTEMYRRANNLDPYTGALLPTTKYGGSTGLNYHCSSAGGTDFSQFLLDFCGLLKAVIFWPIGMAIIVGFVVFGILKVGQKIDAPTLAARVSQDTFASYHLTPLTDFFSEKELAIPVEPEKFLASLHTFKHNKKADSKMKRAHAISGQAYRCFLQNACRESIAKLDPVASENLPHIASGFFSDMVKAGNEDATRDMCLFAVKNGTSYKDMIAARNVCGEALYFNGNSIVGAQISSVMNDLWSMRRAELYKYADELELRLIQQYPVLISQLVNLLF